MPANAAALSVSAVHSLLGDALADLGSLSVRGEISSLTIARSGHAYITLRDRDATLKCDDVAFGGGSSQPFPSRKAIRSSAKDV